MYHLYANETEDLINERKIDSAFLNKAHHTGNYITASNVFSMAGLTLTNEINLIFRNLCDFNKKKTIRNYFFGFHFMSIKTVLLYMVIE